MKNPAAWFWTLLASAFAAYAQAQPQPTLAYTLLDGSYFVDDCLICGRPTIQQPLFGTFDLVRVQNTPPYSRYALRNIDFVASPGGSPERRITGSGTYERFEEFALVQRMQITVQVKDNYTNQLAYFADESSLVEQPFPLIEINLTQTNGTLLQTFSLNLFAAPLREVWFSTTRTLVSTNRPGQTNLISPGDLISNRGRVVKRNIDLVGRLGVMPIVPDLGLDAVQVTRRGEILFSIPSNVWSETRGPIQHGDLLSNRGVIVKRNQDLLAAFDVPTSQPDSGLDAIQVMPDGEILFSIRSNVVTESGGTLAHGDILSDRGWVFRSQRLLLVNFHPAITNGDFGLDAFRLLPSGEIWFSLAKGFTDNRLGTIQGGDVLSTLGRRVFSNQGLLTAFAPVDPYQDYGLNALFTITDLKPSSPRPRLLTLRRAGGSVRIDWEGEGEVFQVEHASSLSGPWLPRSPVLPDLFFDDPWPQTADAVGFYRLRQW